MTAPPAAKPALPSGDSPAAKPVPPPADSLEVRWLVPGPLPAAMTDWFARFQATTETRQDTYLLQPQLPGLSVKQPWDSRPARP
jgi:hypothetical protein